MNKEVSFPLAKLLKAKGYDKKCYKYFHSNFGEEYEYTLKGSDGELCTNWNIEKDYPQDFISAPTIAEVVMWLYEKHGIWIWCDTNSSKKWIWTINIVEKDNFIQSDDLGIQQNPCNSPTEAYEAAILYTLNNLI